MTNIEQTRLPDGWRYVEQARKLGVNVEDPREVKLLMSCIRYCELQFSGRYKNQQEIADALGVHINSISFWASCDFVAVASQIVLASIIDDEARRDKRMILYQSIDEYLPKALLNNLKIASGMPVLSIDARTGKEVLKTPPHRDQVAAFTAISNSPIGNSYLQMILQGNAPNPMNDEHLLKRKALSASVNVVDLDEDIVDVEPIDQSSSTQESNS